MSRSCVGSHRCAFVVIRVMNMVMMATIVRMATIVSATQHAPPQASPRPSLCAVLSTWGIGAGHSEKIRPAVWSNRDGANPTSYATRDAVSVPVSPERRVG
jgi:hypothetical protein